MLKSAINVHLEKEFFMFHVFIEILLYNFTLENSKIHKNLDRDVLELYRLFLLQALLRAYRVLVQMFLYCEISSG